jgi:hypothetical protein
MRVCQFRHYGTVSFAPPEMAGAREPRGLSVTKTSACCQFTACHRTLVSTAYNCRRDEAHRTAILRLLTLSLVLELGSRGAFVANTMTEHANTINEQKTAISRPASEMEKIPEDVSVEMRKIAHDLSNALEIIVQTSYLLSTADLKEPASDWLRMLDGGVQKAMDLNGVLRSYIKQHTAG